MFFYLFQDAREIADSNLDGYLEFVLLGIPSVVPLAGAVWLHESDVGEDLKPRVMGWTIGMASFFVIAMYLARFVIESRFDPGNSGLSCCWPLGSARRPGRSWGS